MIASRLRRPPPAPTGTQPGAGSGSKHVSVLTKMARCKHELAEDKDPELCPFCKLVSRELSHFLSKESAARDVKREESIKHRAVLRFRVLHGWSRIQPLYFCDLFTSQMTNTSLVELVLCSSLVGSLVAQAELLLEEEEKKQQKGDRPVIDMDEMMKLLHRRQRMVEVGEYAATFLQARFRKWGSKRRTRHMLLRRFEFDPNARRGEFFADLKTGRKCLQLPNLVKSERPNTPRTIERRLRGIEKTMEARVVKFRTLLRRRYTSAEGLYKDLWALEEQHIFRQRNMVILADLLDASFAALERLKAREAERAGVQYTPPAPTAPKSAWLTLSAPGPPSRLLGLVLAARTPDFNASFPSTNTTSRPTATVAPPLTTPVAGKKTAPLVRSNTLTKDLKGQDIGERRLTPLELNQRIQALELRAWECLKCNSTQDVLSKLMSPDLLPPLGSSIRIASDDYKIWRGDVEMPKDPSSDAQSPSSGGKSHAYTHAPHAVEEPDLTNMLPMSIHLRPWPEGRNPSNIFRLFFFEGEFVGATQTAVWCMYPEVLKAKDAICESLLEFAESPEVTAFVCSYFTKANANAFTAAPKYKSATSSSSSSSYAPRPRYTTKPVQSCVPIYVPPEEMLFHFGEYLRKPTLSAEETVALGKKYSFLSKISAFKPLLVKAQNAMMRIKRAAPDFVPRAPLPQPSDARVSDFSSLDGDSMKGTSVFREGCIHVPGGHTKREEEYREKLLSSSLLTDPNFHTRLSKPAILKDEDATVRYDLLVLEVACSMRDNKRKCELHQVVGVVSCEQTATRPPRFLDCGLQPWSSFKEMNALQVEESRKGFKPPWAYGPAATLRPQQSAPSFVWSQPDASSGVMTSTNLRTGSGKNVRFSIIGALPTKEHLQSKLKPRMRQWCGIEE